jgi:alpha,alpha-trehalase
MAGLAVPRIFAAQSAAPDQQQWQALDTAIKSWWDQDVSRATEKEIREDKGGYLLFLPFPYIGPTGPGRAFSSMFGWDTDFINRGLLVHGRADLARNHILNYLFMIDRYGYMPNTNLTLGATRSQTPLIADTLWRYFSVTQDLDLLYEAYPRLKRNYQEYWLGSHHQTPIGLATNRDLGDRGLAPELAAEAETGLDWTPVFGGDVRRCVPLITNCALVRYERMIARIAKQIGRTDEVELFNKKADDRTALIHKYCWNESAGFFVEYDYTAAKQLPYLSACAYWTLWAGVATEAQAKRLAQNLRRLEKPFGLSVTDKTYPLPLPLSTYDTACFVTPEGELSRTDPGNVLGGHEQLQWMYPAGWAPLHLIVAEGLEAYGYASDARRLAAKFLGMVLTQYQRTGQLWEKYNVVDGGVYLPNARCGNTRMHGWTAAAAALLGRNIFEGRSLQSI